MPHKLFSGVTDIFHDWDGVYVHYKDFDAFWLTSAKIAIEEGIRSCLTSAAEEIKAVWVNSQKTEKPYETAFDVLHHEFGLDYEVCFKRHHEILLSDYAHTFRMTPEVCSYLKPLNRWSHHVLTHANHYWVDVWSDKNKTKLLFDTFYSCSGDAIGRKDSECLSVYRQLEKLHGKLPSQCLLLDDSLFNLKQAHAAGWKTVWIKGSKTEPKPDYVDASYSCVTEFLKDLARSA